MQGRSSIIFPYPGRPGYRLRVVPHFSSGIVERAKRECAWKSLHARKGDTRRGERKMRDYRQSLSFWPFTADWFWSVKFVSPSKSIKCIQWHPFPHWAVIALVICKLPVDVYWKQKKTQILIFFTAVAREELDSVGNARLLLMPKCCLFQWIFFFWTDRLCSGGKRFDWANVIFAAYFILRGLDTHINFLRLLSMVGMICPLMQEHFLWPLLKSKALQCG